jgi:hypothetical protein
MKLSLLESIILKFSQRSAAMLRKFQYTTFKNTILSSQKKKFKQLHSISTNYHLMLPVVIDWQDF